MVLAAVRIEKERVSKHKERRRAEQAEGKTPCQG